MSELTLDDLMAGYDDPRWLGFGYLGGRQNEVLRRPSRVKIADQLVIRIANEQEWDREILFHWSNSKPGRWFADAVFGSDEPVSLEWLRMACWTLFRQEVTAFVPGD